MKRRNPLVKDLKSAKYKKRVQPSKKKYSRKDKAIPID